MFAYRQGSALIEIQDYHERRRIQNLLAQRRWRQKARERNRNASRSPRPVPATEDVDNQQQRQRQQPRQQSGSSPLLSPLGVEYVEGETSTWVPSPQTSYLDPGTGACSNVSPYPATSAPTSHPSLYEPVGDLGQNMGSGYPLVSTTLPPGYNMNLRPNIEQGPSTPNNNSVTESSNPGEGTTLRAGMDFPTTSQGLESEVKRKIIESMETTEGLFECGLMMNIFPERNNFQRHLANAKAEFLSLPGVSQGTGIASGGLGATSGLNEI